MKRAIERHQCGEARIIPVIARKCDWLDSPLGKITALPIDGKSIASFADKDDAYMQIVLGIKEAIKELGWIDWINVYNFYRILRDFI